MDSTKNILFLTCAGDDPYKIEFAKSIGAKIKALPFGKIVSLMKQYPFLGHFYAYLSLFYSFFIDTNDDILIVDGWSSMCTAAHLKKRVENIKLIYLDNDTMFYNVQKRKTAAKKGLKFFLDSIDGVISVSEQNKKYSSKFLDVPIEVCPPYPKPVKKQKIKRGDYGLYVGRLDPDKNIERIIQFGLQCPFFERFIVIGSGSQENYVKKMARMHKKIIFQGKKDDVEKYYSQCKFLIHINDYDPHPRTTMEAALCGCFPIISKNVGTHYLFDKMFVVNNPENFYEINDQIENILDNETKAKKLLQKSIKKILTKEKSIKQFNNSFLNLIKEIEKRGGE